MRILIYTPTYMGSGHNAGAETTLHDLARALKRAGHEVLALASRPFKDGSGSYVLDGVKVQAFGSKRDPELYFPGNDVILTQFECAQRAWYIGQALDIPTVQVVHNTTEYATNLARRYNDYLVYNSKHSVESVAADKPYVVCHPIVDPKRYAVDSTREYITLINLSDGTEPFYNKGYETFYELAYRFPGEKFLGVKGAYGNQALPGFITPAGEVTRDLPNVTILEHTNNVLDVYRQTKIILMPSEIESWGRVPIEAGCSAIPSITSRTPGLLESDIGWHQADFNDHDAWEAVLAQMLNRDGNSPTDYSAGMFFSQLQAQELYEQNIRETNDFVKFIEGISE